MFIRVELQKDFPHLLISPPIDRPKCPEDDPNEHPDWKSSRGKDNVSCFGKTGLLAGEVGNEGNKEETTLK